MSFRNANHLDIKGGHFVNVSHGDAHLHFSESLPARANNNQGLDILRQNVATGSFYDAAERGDPPKCHPNTRMAILSAIQEWVRDSSVRRKFIIWLYGPAGSGKSAIAQATAEIFAKEHLAASFFFSRTGIGRNDTSRFIASISYQLSISIPEIRPHISAAVEQDLLIFTRTLLSQMEVLIIKPLNAAATDLDQASAAYPKLVIIDGLDETSEASTQRDLLQALAISIQQLRIPLIFVVTSRPETIIRQTFNREPLQSLMERLALDAHYKPDDDIRIFLFAEFNEIRELHPSGNALPVEWPTQEDIDYLVRKASGQFIYASTVMKYIKSPERNPTTQLKIILNMADSGNDTPFAQLDALYALILSSVDNLTRVLDILALIFFQTGYAIESYLTVYFIETLLEYDSGDVAAALTNMHALVRVPSNSGDDPDNLHIYHASLHDFLTDKSRSKRFFLDAKVRHTDLARRLFKYIITASEEEYEDDYRFSAVLNGFIHHYREVSNIEELVTDLKTFSLTSLLSNITMETFYDTKWDPFFDHLQSECIETNTDLYLRLRNEFDDWIRNRYEQYPVFIQRCISALLATMDDINVFLCVPDIFNILTHTLPSSEAIRLRELDRKLLVFQEMPSMWLAESNQHSVLYNFFTDPARAGVHFPDKVKFGNLAEHIAKVLCPREKPRPQIMVVESYSSDDDSDSGETLKIENTDLVFFPKILAAAQEDHKLAQLLWEIAIKYEDDADDPIREGRKTMAESALQYMNRCGIFIPEHEHQAGCSICADFTPSFSVPSIEPKEDSTQQTISTPDKPGALQSRISPSLSENISSKTLAIPANIPHSSSFRSPIVPRSPTTTRKRAAKIPPSATHHLSDSIPTSLFSPGSRSIGSRSTSADPSTSKSGSHRLSDSLSVASRARPQSTMPSNSSLSPYSSHASTVAQTSMGNLPRPKERYEHLVSVGVPPKQKSTTGKAPKKPWK